MRKNTIHLLNEIPMEKIFELYNIKWQEGRNFKCPFPAHGASGRTPSGRFYPDTNSFGCFGCHKGGGPIAFVMNMEEVSFEEAGAFLMEKFNIEEEARPSAQRLVDRKKLEEEKYHLEVKLNYLYAFWEQEENRETKDIGYLLLYALHRVISEDIFLSLLKRLSSEEFLIEEDIDLIFEDLDVFNTFSTNEEILKDLSDVSYIDERRIRQLVLCGFVHQPRVPRWKELTNKLVFPIKITKRHIYGFSSRDLAGGIVKYLTHGSFDLEKKDIIYGLDVAIPFIKEKGYVILVEGIIDVARCRHVGFLNTVCCMSTYMSAKQGKLLSMFTDKFLLCFDADYGGLQATKLTKEVLEENALFYEEVNLPEDQDPDTFGLSNPKGLKELLSSKWDV